MRRILMVAVLLIVTSFPGSAAERPSMDESLSANLQQALDAVFAQFDVRGCSTAVLFSDDGLWLGTAGFSHETTAVSSNMLFSLSSITKTYISPLVLQLAEEGKLSLDDKLSQWLPDSPFIAGDITIRQLLNQRSGLCNFSDRADLWKDVLEEPVRVWQAEEILDAYVFDPCSAPGQGWIYSNTGYLILGLIIEQATHGEVGRELRTRFLDPLQLEKTFFSVEEPSPDDIPVCHGWFDLDGDGLLDDVLPFQSGIYSTLWTAGAIFATAGDLARWVDSLMKGDVLTQASLDQMLTPYSIVPDSGGVGYGLGVNLYGGEGISSTGRSFGYLSLFLYLPEQRATLVVLLNGDDSTCLDSIASALTLVVMNHAMSAGE